MINCEIPYFLPSFAIRSIYLLGSFVMEVVSSEYNYVPLQKQDIMEFLGSSSQILNSKQILANIPIITG